MVNFTPYNLLSVCSGVGGLDLAVSIAVRNARTVCHIEREAQAAAVLAARMEEGSLHEAPIWSDLSTFDGKPWRGAVDCVISGDPCQPNSVAGSRLGAQDDRFLIDQLIRVIDEVRPSRVFRENVTGNADGQLAALIPALERMGYSVAAGIFSAGEVGASHRRERLFIMAHNSSEGLERQIRPEFERGRNRLADKGGDVADAISVRRRPESDDQLTPEQPNQAISYLPYFAPGPNDARWAEIIQEYPSLKPALCTMADGVANRVDELRAAGNGVCSMAGAIAWLSLSAHFE